MAINDTELIQAWRDVLSQSHIGAGKSVVLLCGPATHNQTQRTAAIAAQAAGCIVTRLDLPAVNGDRALSRDPFAYLGETALSGNAAALAALKACDLVLDLMGLLFSPEQAEILAGGTRILLALEPPEVLMRTVPNQADRERVRAAATRLRAARTMRVRSAAGTDVRFALGEFPTIEEYGLADADGRWDHWPSGFLFTFPNEGGSDGRLVIDRGDILLPQKTYVSEPVTLQVREGYVRSIDGGLDAELLRDYIESFDDPEAYAMSHIGWGLQPRCRWSTLSLYDKEQTIAMDARAFEGNFLFSLGPNNEAGGRRTTACHLDIPLRRCTVSIDDRVVVDAGRVVDGAV